MAIENNRSVPRWVTLLVWVTTPELWQLWASKTLARWLTGDSAT